MFTVSSPHLDHLKMKIRKNLGFKLFFFFTKKKTRALNKSYQGYIWGEKYKFAQLSDIKARVGLIDWSYNDKWMSCSAGTPCKAQGVTDKGKQHSRAWVTFLYNADKYLAASSLCHGSVYSDSSANSSISRGRPLFAGTSLVLFPVYLISEFYSKTPDQLGRLSKCLTLT